MVGPGLFRGAQPHPPRRTRRSAPQNDSFEARPIIWEGGKSRRLPRIPLGNCWFRQETNKPARTSLLSRQSLTLRKIGTVET